MDDTYSIDENAQFLDASDEFPFFDCPNTSISSSSLDDSPSTSQSTLSPPSFPYSAVSSSGLRRRRSLRNRKFSDLERDCRTLDSDIVESTSESVVEADNESCTITTVKKPEDSSPPPPTVRNRENADEGEFCSLVNQKESSSVPSDVKAEDSPPPLPVGERENDDGQFNSLGDLRGSSTVTTDVKPEDLLPSPSQPVREGENDDYDGEFSSLGNVAELLIKAIGFQFNLLLSFVSFPFWVLYYSCMFALNPLFIIGLGKTFLIRKLTRLWKIVSDTLSPFMSEWLNENKSWLKLVLRCSWGLFWSVYVCSVLVVLLIGAFVIGGLMMRFVEEPFQLRQGLNFDYTKSKPVAFVPITVCPVAEYGDKDDVVNVGFARVIPWNQKLQATVTMVLPESDYNRNLGVFQVRIEFLSGHGKSLASFSHPCMLEFKSQPLRLLLTFCKIVPLVAGYLSETQTLKLKFRGYKEGAIPTACLKITMEQRAEFRPAAGIPEVYDAFVHLESKLPFFKRILWYWRRTIFVWLSMMLFTLELLFALVCCRPVIFPRARTQSNITRRNTPVTAHPVQR